MKSKVNLRVSPYIAFIASVGGVCFLLSGCTLEEAKDAPATPAPPIAPVHGAPSDMAVGGAVPPSGSDSSTAGGGASMGSGAPMMGMAPPMNPLTPTPELDKKIADAEKGSDKKAIAAAYAARGTYRMNDAAAGPRVKYRKALADFRKALVSDPSNADASTGLKTIEDIYQSMGRPVPQDDSE